jgi:iron(III) transport system permease protein
LNRFARVGRGFRWLDLAIGVVVISIAGLIVWPIGTLLFEVFFANGVFSASNASEALSDPGLRAALVNTVILVGGSTALALVIGSVLAWLNERTDARIGWVSDIVPVIPLLVPPVAGAIGWVFVFAPRAGYLNALFRHVLQPQSDSTARGPIDIYTLGGVIFVSTLFLVPLAYLTASAALRNLDASLEEASRVSGAGPLRTLFRVGLPSIRPALASAAALLIISGVELFVVPLIIGTQARFDVLSTLIYRDLSQQFPPRLGEAIVLSAFMLFAVQVGILGEYLITRSGRHAKTGGRAQAWTPTRLGSWRWPARALIVLYLVVSTIVPVGGLLLASLQNFWSPSVAWDRLSLGNYATVFLRNDATHQALVNSLVLGAVAATATMMIAAMVAFYVQRASGVLGRLVSSVMVLPGGLPPVVIGVGFLLTVGYPTLGFNQTFIPLFLAYLVILSPQAARAASSALSQVGSDLWEISLMCGASSLRTFIRILLPLMLTGLISGWLIVFVLAFREVNASVFLSASQNPVIGPVLLNIWQVGGSFPELAALALVITLLNTGIVLGTLGLARVSMTARPA